MMILSGWRVPLMLAGCAVVASASICSARASVLESTPTLPLLGFPYTTPGGNCFPTAGFCVSSGTLVLTSLTGPGFVQNGANEDITTNATDTLELTDTSPSHNSLGTLVLTGPVEQKVVGRLNAFDQGSWTVDLLSVSLSGSLGGFPVTLTLNPADTSSGTTTIAQDGALFRVDSFFDVFADITYHGPNGVLEATASGTASAGVPEPATLALLAGPVLAVSAARRRRR